MLLDFTLFSRTGHSEIAPAGSTCNTTSPELAASIFGYGPGHQFRLQVQICPTGLPFTFSSMSTGFLGEQVAIDVLVLEKGSEMTALEHLRFEFAEVQSTVKAGKSRAAQTLNELNELIRVLSHLLRGSELTQFRTI